MKKLTHLIPRRTRLWWAESPWLNETSKRKNMVMPYVLIALGLISGLALYAGQRSAADAQQSHDIALNTYITDANTYTSCVVRSTSRDDLRSALNDLFDFLEDLATRFDALDLAADVVAAQVEFNAKYQPVLIQTCGLPPAPPNGVHPLPIPIPVSPTTVPDTAAA